MSDSKPVFDAAVLLHTNAPNTINGTKMPQPGIAGGQHSKPGSVA